MLAQTFDKSKHFNSAAWRYATQNCTQSIRVWLKICTKVFKEKQKQKSPKPPLCSLLFHCKVFSLDCRIWLLFIWVQKMKWLQSNRFTFVILQFHFLPNDAKMQYKLLSKIVALLLHSHTHTHTPSLLHSYSQIHKCRQKASIEFLYKFFFDFSRLSQCFCVRMRAHWLHTHTHIGMYVCIMCVWGCVCGCVCLFFVSPSCARLWLEMHKSVFVHIKYSCIILNPLAIFSIWFPI